MYSLLFYLYIYICFVKSKNFVVELKQRLRIYKTSPLRAKNQVRLNPSTMVHLCLSKCTTSQDSYYPTMVHNKKEKYLVSNPSTWSMSQGPASIQRHCNIPKAQMLKLSSKIPHFPKRSIRTY